MYKKLRNFIMKQKKFTKISSTVLIIILFVSIPFVYKQMNMHTKNKNSIHSVIKTMFTCPNNQIIEQLEQFSDNPNLIGDEILLTDDKIIQDFNNLLDELYATYFTQDGFMRFKAKRCAIQFHEQCYYNNYQLMVKNIKITPEKKVNNSYSVAIILLGNRDGNDQEEINISMQVRCDDIGKMGYINIFSNSERLLYSTIRGNE